MQASQLKPGDRFSIPNHVDPEGPVRVCLTNNTEEGVRWGFPGRAGFWCYMGELVEVVRLPRCGKCTNCVKLERVKTSVLRCCNPPFSHTDRGAIATPAGYPTRGGVVDVWNDQLASLPCLGSEE